MIQMMWALVLIAKSKVKAQPVELASTWLCINDTLAEGFIIRTYNRLKRMEHCTAVVASLLSCKVVSFKMHPCLCRWTGTVLSFQVLSFQVTWKVASMSECAANSSIVI